MLKFCANLSWMFREVPFLARPEAARRAGFSGIEFHSPEEHSAGEVARAAREAGVTIVLINASSRDFLQGGPGLSGVPGREAEFRQVVRETGEFAAELGGVHMQIGQSRVPDGVAREECMRVYVENLRYAAIELARARSRPLIEPMNRTDFPGVLVADLQTALSAMAQSGDSRIGLQFDVYHQHMTAADAGACVEALGSRIDHLQISDAPGRHEPGTGCIDFSAIFRKLDLQAYPHWVAAEYRPSRATPETLGWLNAYLSSPHTVRRG